MTPEHRYRLIISPTARRQLAEVLPEAVAFAAHEFIVGPLLENPHRVGKRLEPPLSDRHSARRGTYRVIYRIDEAQHAVTVLAVGAGNGSLLMRRTVERPATGVSSWPG